MKKMSPRKISILILSAVLLCSVMVFPLAETLSNQTISLEAAAAGEDAIEIVSFENLSQEMTVDRSKGDILSLPTDVVAVDKDGKKYTATITWENASYRSGKEGDYAFVPVTTVENVTFASSASVIVKNRINGDFDATVSTKYYFDHTNDFLDFTCHYAKYNTDGTWSSYNGDLAEADPTSKWMISNGKATTVQQTNNNGYSVTNMFQNLTTLVLKEETGLNLKSYKLEMDFEHGSSWWYTYMLLGVQDPSKYVGILKNEALHARENATQGGVYYWIEQEGYFNFMGSLVSGGEKVRLDSTYVYDNTNWPNDYVRDNTHHMTAYVFGQKAFVSVDNSGYIEVALSSDAVGGLAGFACHNSGSTVSNFQITAIDGDTFNPVNDTCTTVPLATAERGWAPDKSYDTYMPWVPTGDQLEVDWKTRLENIENLYE